MTADPGQDCGRFDGKVAVVSGGDSGIGAAVVARLRRGGATAMVADLTGERPVDVTDAAAVDALAEQVRDSWGRCDILVNCAGALAMGTALEVDEADWDKAFAVNVRGPWLMCRAFLPLMPNGSAIVNVSSAAGLRPIPDMAAYVASKSALVGLTRAMALDHADLGVRVNCVCPGLVDTPMASRAQTQRPAQSSAAVAAFEGYLIKREADADELAAAVCFLASDAAGYLTGSTLAVDGGRTLH